MMTMRKYTSIAAIISILVLCQGCRESMGQLTDRVMERAASQFLLADARLACDSLPKTFENGKCIDSDIQWWCSGFFPGSLWYVYEYSGNERIREVAVKNTLKLESIMEYPIHHDIGFQINCSYGNAYRITGDPAWKPMMEKSAERLADRFSPTVGCTRSWNSDRFRYPVIIDNMMNLEHLLNCGKIFDRNKFTEVARIHANTTMKNHFRPDYSCWHLVDYDPATGKVDHKQTVQGFADDSAWSRGQAWALYGYTMMYERTGVEEFLQQAEKVAGYILPRLCADGIPYWDFNAPGTPEALSPDSPGASRAINELAAYSKDKSLTHSTGNGDTVLRDASAAAVMASGFITLSKVTRKRSLARQCRAVAKKQLRTLASDEYMAQLGENGGFLLKHSVGSLPGGTEVDVPVSYADYYFLEALLKLSR